MKLFTELSVGAQTAYAELYEAAQAQEAHRSIAHLNGSFAKKNIAGKTYWYFAYRDLNGQVRQLYLGPESEALDRVRATASKRPPATIVRQGAAAIALGCVPAVPKHFRIIRRLSEYQFFRAGGILVGTHAFAALGNLLGLSWSHGTRTLDVDFAHAGPGGNITLALPASIESDVHTALESLEMGFLPALSVTSNEAAAGYVSTNEAGLRVDFMMPLRRSTHAVRAPNLNIAVTPMKFLDYLLEGSTQGVVFAPGGAVVVNLPDPARYGLHKLIVAGERPAREATKATKDRWQSAALMAYFLDRSPEQLLGAWEALIRQGEGWKKRAMASIERLPDTSNDVGAAFLQMVKPKPGSPRLR